MSVVHHVDIHHHSGPRASAAAPFCQGSLILCHNFLWIILYLILCLIHHYISQVTIPCRTCIPSQNIKQILDEKDVTWVNRYAESSLDRQSDTSGCNKPSCRIGKTNRRFAQGEQFAPKGIDVSLQYLAALIVVYAVVVTE